MVEWSAHRLGLVFSVCAQPGSRKNAVLGERSGSLRVAVSAAPEKGKANAAIARVLAEALGCKGSQITLLSGETSREKRFLVTGMTADEFRSRFDRLGVVRD